MSTTRGWWWLALLGACSERVTPPPAVPQLAPPLLAPVVDEALARTADHGLPAVDADAVLDVADLLELWAAGGAGSPQATRALEHEDAGRLAACLLALSEDLATTAETRRSAAAWLAARAPSAALPRLTLRLKYEKDWVASADLARGLLRLGSGAGIEALVAILREEAREEAMYVQARARAAEALRALPPRTGWTPGAEFAADWERLLDVRAEWESTRTLPGATAPPPGPDAEAEFWRTIALLRSQPLRPVDDARFVLARAPADYAYPALLAATREQDRYVRDHVLETVSWIGAPLGRWAQRHGVDAAHSLAELIGDAATRPRAIEALGALGDPRAAPWVQAWLLGGPEECTAAADALLRCAGPEHAAMLALTSGCTPEAAFSLALLRRRFDPSLPPPDPGTLDAAEVARRRQWDAERAAAQ